MESISTANRWLAMINKEAYSWVHRVVPLAFRFACLWPYELLTVVIALELPSWVEQCLRPSGSEFQMWGHSSGAVWESRWPSWAVCPNEPSGFRGRKELLNHASALVTTCPVWYVNWHLWGHSESVKGLPPRRFFLNFFFLCFNLYCFMCDYYVPLISALVLLKCGNSS